MVTRIYFFLGAGLGFALESSSALAFAFALTFGPPLAFALMQALGLGMGMLLDRISKVSESCDLGHNESQKRKNNLFWFKVMIL